MAEKTKRMLQQSRAKAKAALSRPSVQKGPAPAQTSKYRREEEKPSLLDNDDDDDESSAPGQQRPGAANLKAKKKRRIGAF